MSSGKLGVLVLGGAVASFACGGPADEGAEEGDTETTAGVEERQRIHVAREGGQTGMEGGCVVKPEPEAEAFTSDDVRALIEGTQMTTLAYRMESPALGAELGQVDGLPMAVTVELQGEPRVLDPALGGGCNLRIDQDVRVTLGFEEPALDVVIET